MPSFLFRCMGHHPVDSIYGIKFCNLYTVIEGIRQPSRPNEVCSVSYDFFQSQSKLGLLFLGFPINCSFSSELEACPVSNKHEH